MVEEVNGSEKAETLGLESLVLEADFQLFQL